MVQRPTLRGRAVRSAPFRIYRPCLELRGVVVWHVAGTVPGVTRASRDARRLPQIKKGRRFFKQPALLAYWWVVQVSNL